jgi:murein L,D-transpeptidase YafK
VRWPARLALLWWLTAQAWAASPPEPCVDRGVAVVVRTTEHQLYACEANRPVQSYGIRLGRKGTGKRKAGDGKTPLGSYGLGVPRTSKKYGLFIPVGYPTAEQRRQGYTGGDIGVHGPLRSVRWLGRAVNWFDTSDGCIGLATDEEMATLAAWVRARRPRLIVIE